MRVPAWCLVGVPLLPPGNHGPQEHRQQAQAAEGPLHSLCPRYARRTAGAVLALASRPCCNKQSYNAHNTHTLVLSLARSVAHVRSFVSLALSSARHSFSPALGLRDDSDSDLFCGLLCAFTCCASLWGLPCGDWGPKGTGYVICASYTYYHPSGHHNHIIKKKSKGSLVMSDESSILTWSIFTLRS